MVAGTDPVQQILHPGRRVGDTELLLDPGPHLHGVVKGPFGDLLAQLLDLCGSQPTGITVIVHGTQLVQALVAEDAEPVPDLAAGDPQQLGHLVPGASLVDPQQGGETLEDAAVGGLSPPFLDLLALLGTQRDGINRSPPGRGWRPQPTP